MEEATSNLEEIEKEELEILEGLAKHASSEDATFLYFLPGDIKLKRIYNARVLVSSLSDCSAKYFANGILSRIEKHYGSAIAFYQFARKNASDEAGKRIEGLAKAVEFYVSANQELSDAA